jgi:hypothetical protein
MKVKTDVKAGFVYISLTQIAVAKAVTVGYNLGTLNVASAYNSLTIAL